MAKRKKENPEKYFVFELDGSFYGIDVSRVIEVAPVEKITRVPGTPEYIEGVMNLRGRLVPVINTRTRLGMRSKSYSPKSALIIIRLEKNGSEHDGIGISVDKVHEIIQLDSADIHSPKSDLPPREKNFVKVSAQTPVKLIKLLDTDKLLEKEDSGFE